MIEKLKNIYEDFLVYKKVDKKIDIICFEKYLNEIYQKKLQSTEFFRLPSILDRLGVSEEEFSSYVFESIYTNIYLDLVIILQNLDNKNFKIPHEYFLTRYRYNNECNLELSKNCIERFRKRMQPSRLNSINKFKLENETTCFYIPSVLRAYKDTLLIQRSNLSIMDISENFIDIFSYLMFDTDEEVGCEILKRSKEILKSYRFWDFGKMEVLCVKEIYSKVLNKSSNSDFKPNKLAEFIFLEKLFGLFSISKLIKTGYISDNNIIDTYPLQKLGYTSLTEFLLSKIHVKNHSFFNTVIKDYIHPFCSDIIMEIMYNTLYTIEQTNSIDEAIEFIKNFIELCNSKIIFEPSENMLESLDSITEKRIARMIRIRNLSETEKSNNELCDVIRRCKKKFSDKYYATKYEKTVDFQYLFDKSIPDLTLRYFVKENNHIIPQTFNRFDRQYSNRNL